MEAAMRNTLYKSSTTSCLLITIFTPHRGVGGILISIAKLVLTTVCAGIHPNRQLPVVLDCGTDNEELLKDGLYLGIQKPRIRGKKYDDFVDIFVQSARNLYPNAYIHFEDFGLANGKLPNHPPCCF